jgi:hypothetical protein
MTYSWDCRTVDTYPTQGELTDVVYNVHWRLTGTEDAHSATVIGTQSLTAEDIQPEGFIAFEDLTHEQVIAWVEEAMGEERVAELKASVDSQVASLITPTSVTKTIGVAVEPVVPTEPEVTEPVVEEGTGEE